MTTLTLAQASIMVDTALKTAREKNFAPLTVAVLDAGGHLTAFKREDKSGILRFDIAFGKAWGALGMGLGSRTLAGRAPKQPAFFTALSAASGGRIGAKHIRAIKPFGEPTGWHWHDMTGHFVIILKGWITFRFAGHQGDVTVREGTCLSPPARVAHNVIARSDDLELIEINLPAEFGTMDLGGAKDSAQP